VFVDEHGRPLRLDHISDGVRDHLAAAGLTRPALHTAGTNTGRFGLHRFRRSFVTRSFARGHSEDWVRQRTGHKSEELLSYRQAAGALADLDLGELERLDAAIPELPGPSQGTPGGHDEPERRVGRQPSPTRSPTKFKMRP